MKQFPLFLIPFVIVGAVLIPLWILLWLGKRERRQVSTLTDPDLGKLVIYKNYWETSTEQLVSSNALEVAGVAAAAGPSEVQRATLKFVRDNAAELFQSAVTAAKSELLALKPNTDTADLTISQLFLGRNQNEFEFNIDSESCKEMMPDGVSVSFIGKEIDQVEFVH